MQTETKFEGKGEKFECLGICLSRPDDLQPPGKFPILKNVTSYQQGVLQQRPGTGAGIYSSVAAGLRVHSIRRMNEYSTDDYLRVIGHGGNLSIGHSDNTLVQIDTGYSGQPLSMIPFRPENANVSWMYIGDVLRNRKAGFYGNTNYAIGIAPPITPPEITQNPFLFKVLDDPAYIGGWAPTGGGGAVTSPQRPPAATTIAAIKYDSGSTQWACVQLANAASDFSAFGVGGRYIFGGTETAILMEAHNPASSTIGSIIYDSGTSGMCTIQPAAAIPGYQRNAMVRIAAAEYVRILSTTIGPDGQFSFRCVTTGTRSAGDAIAGFPSYRFYFAGTFAAGAAVTGQATQFTITVTPPATSAQCSMSVNLGTPIDLTTTNGRPIQADDYMHISILADILTNVTEMRVALDVDINTTNVYSVNDFTKNFFYKTFRANDFAAAAQAQLTSITSRQTAIQRDLIDSSEGGQPLSSPTDQTDPPENSTPTSNQTGTGNTQWSELQFKISDLIRVGTDPSASMKSVKAMRVYFTVTATTTLAFEGWWLGGTFGPDTPPPTDGFYYRYRYRSSATGAHSLPGPAQRTPEFCIRQALFVGSLAFSTDPQVDKIDIERQGGINNEWHYIGTKANSGDNFFIDILDSVAIKTNDPLDIDAMQPWPVTKPYIDGFVDVAGTAVKFVSGSTFNVNWAAGVEINIDGTLYTLYAPPGSTTLLSTQENVGTKTNAPWFIQEQLVTGQPLPVIFGPFHNFIFALGDINRPGTLLYTKGNDPDSAPENYNQEVTDPSEPLMNGAALDSRAYLFSNARMFGIYPNFDSPLLWRIDEIANARGLFARWAICTGGGNIYYLAKDGIYRTGGEGFENITDADLYNLFPHDAQPGTAVNGFAPPDMTLTNDLRLSYCDNWLQFAYIDTDGNHQVLAYNTLTKAWFPWHIDLPVGSIQMFYGDEGRNATQLIAGASLNGKIYSMTIDATDDGIPIAGQFRTPALDQGDPRMEKKYGDAVLETDSGGNDLTCQLGFNNSLTTLASVTRNSSVRQFVQPLEINAGVGQLGHNISLDVQWEGNAQFFYWEPSYVPQPVTTQLRATDWMDAEYDGAKFVQGVILTADTDNVAKTLQVQFDGGQSGPLLSVTHNGEEEKAYPDPNSGEWVPFIAHQMRLLPTESLDWRYFGARWVYEPAPELVTRWITQETTHDLPGWQHVRYGFVPYISYGSAVLIIAVDGVEYTYALPDSAGAFAKEFLIFQPIKGKFFKYSIKASGGIRVFLKDVEMYAKAWGSAEAYTRVLPFGDISRLSGARI